MVKVLVQAARVGGVGIGLAGLLAVLGGIPDTAPDPSAGLCMPPATSDGQAGETAPTIRWVTQEDARLKQADGDGRTLFVDARPHNAFHQGHVAGALSVPMDRGTVPGPVVSRLGAADTVVCYCDTSDGCGQSTRLAALLASAGLPDVRVLEGGLPAWLDNGFPAESSLCEGEEDCE